MKEKLEDLGKKIDDINLIILSKTCKNCKLKKKKKKKNKLIPWLSKTELMEYLRISTSTYHNWRNKGIIEPCSTIGEDRFLIKDVNKIIIDKGKRKRRKNIPPK